MTGTNNSNETSEVAYLNALLAPPPNQYAAADVDKTTANGTGNDSFSISGAYFWLKIDGPNTGYLYFQNDDGTQTVEYTGTGMANGLSHYAQVVPIPAAVLMFLTALGALAGWRRWSGGGEGLTSQAA